MAFGQSRLFLVWPHLILPHNRSLVFECAPGTGSAGAGAGAAGLFIFIASSTIGRENYSSRRCPITKSSSM
ncbi:hypothetical protein [Yoonia sp. SS1-5]|uniref:Uncharacterized protein n=1 Tax=Yoonia rhodophyticola TaxID=3137370 RepID=A0ABZ3JB55_9RHOB